MKTIAVVSGLALLHQATAACCRGNVCLKAIASAGSQGADDCSANLVVTVTPATVTITQTSAFPTDYLTVVSTRELTVTETTTAATETDVMTVSVTSASTETDVQVATKTLTATDVETQTSSSTSTITLADSIFRRATSAPELPIYASQCPSWDSYVSACSCAGVVPLTVTADAPSATVTVDAASTSTVSVLSIATGTETALYNVTATASTTATDVVSDTATTLVTQTTDVSTTVTATTTVDSVATATCTPGQAAVQNSRFENGLQGWQIIPGATGVVDSPPPPGTDGQAALGVQLPTNGYLAIQQTLSTSPGVRYTGSVNYWFSTDAVNCYLEAFMNGAWFWSLSPQYNWQSVQNWVNVPLDYTSSQGGDVLKIQFLCTAFQAVEIRLDNLMLTSVPSGLAC